MQLMLTFHCLILLVHEVNIVLFFIIEPNWLLLSRHIRLLLHAVAYTFSLLLDLFLLSAASAADHSFEVLECNHHNSHIVERLPH